MLQHDHLPVGLPDGDLLTLAEITAYLRISRTTARRLIDRGDLDAVRVGSQIRVERSSLPRLRMTPTRPRA